MVTPMGILMGMVRQTETMKETATPTVTTMGTVTPMENLMEIQMATD